MADKRKLQTEIDRCLKQVAERIEIFEETWDKVQSASNSNQKDKYEGDLKKEIKKLQRLRDQIKTWLASNDVKTQRTVLAEKRRLIEVQMERFKIIERETKTKAFSKEGLALAAKVDPREKERNEVRDWLNESCDELRIQIDRFEAEIESSSSGKKKKKTVSENEAQLLHWIERHNFHISKLEMLMRLIDNNTVEDLDKTIKEGLEEDIKYYLQENQDPDFCENEYMYDDLEEIMRNASNSMGAVNATKLRHQAEEAARKEQEQKEKERKAQLQKEKEQREAEKRRENNIKAEQEKVAAALAAATAAEKKKAAAAAAAAKKVVSGDGGNVAKSPAQKLPGKNFAAVAGTAPPASPPGSKTPTQGSGLQPPTPTSSWTDRAQPPRSPGKENSGRSPAAAALPSLGNTSVPGLQHSSGEQGASPSQMQNMQMLLVSSMNLPEPPEHQTGFKPQNPYNVPVCYPTQPPAHFSQAAFFASLETDTLFFIFYHQQGTYQQYLAARELKKQAWRFHKKYLTWFQRFEEPKVITDEYEQGTYVYFDFEAGWCQRKKGDFTFEYRFLEDQELP